MSDPVKPEGSEPQTPSDKKSSPSQSELDFQKLQKQMEEMQKEKQELAASLSKYKEAEQKAEEARLTEQNKWQEIAKQKQEELDKATAIVNQMKQSEVRNTRVRALMKEIGSVRNEEYLQFANLDMIDVVDGKVDPKSVKLVAEDFQRRYPDLIGSKKPASNNSHAATEPHESGDKIPDMSIKANRDKALASLTLK